MIEAPTLTLAFAAGVVSFVSPCCLPLVPGYLATVCGRPVEEGGFDPAVLRRSIVFVAGFSMVFILLGLGATALGGFLVANSGLLEKIAGVVIIAMGLFFIASVLVVRLNRDFRPPGLLERSARGGPLIAGVAFAFAWTPCIGPTLGAILSLASLETSVAAGAGLLAIYSAGLALPFIASAVAFGGAQRSLAWIKNHHAAIQVASGLVLVAMGILVASGELFRLSLRAQELLDAVGLNFFKSV
ncbi:cytochrome c biogenesis protein CcdA [Thermoleophilia bacterium SCSIO 60948]|nr:cytochrome c biogenesis protein CcdA [Thermoleophilia bacterium SCSIO 60948]